MCHPDGIEVPVTQTGPRSWDRGPLDPDWTQILDPDHGIEVPLTQVLTPSIPRVPWSSCSSTPS